MPTVPRIDTPYVDNGDITDIVQWGDRIVLVGNFTEVGNAGQGPIAQSYIAAYDIETGLLDTGFLPDVDRQIAEAAVSADGDSLYIVGRFNTVNGTTRRKVAKLNPDGSLDTAFRANANSRASAIAVANDAVYVGGFFARVNGTSRGLLVKLDPDTGAVDPTFDLPITEGLGSGGTLKVQSLTLTTDGGTLLVVHTGHRIDGLLRAGVALVDTATESVLPWQTDLFEDNLINVGGVLRVTAGDISPDDAYFVVVSGSGGDRPPINDTAMAFPMSAGAGVEPLWVSRHFDSIYSVAIAEETVYVGGHFRWQEAPGSTDPWPGDTTTSYGWNNGQGAAVLGDEVLRRDQIGALDPSTGKAQDWNPGSNAFEGVLDLALVPRGLLVSHDGQTLGGRNVGFHGFFDFESVPEPDGSPETTITDPISGQSLPGGPFEIRGTASADAGIRRAQIEVRNQSTRQHLQDDLVSWGRWNAIVVSLDDPDATSTTWRQEVDLPSGSYRVRARTIADDGSRDPTKAEVRFDVDAITDAPPVASVVYPATNAIVNTPSFTVQGTATDDVGVNEIRLVFRMMDTNLYLQDDGTVAAGWNSFWVDAEPQGEPVVTWEYDVTLPVEGEWRITAAARDTSGQLDTSATRRTFFLFANNEAPAVEITSHSGDDITIDAGTAVTFSGIATDDVQVDRVQIRVRNTRTREGMASNGLFGIANYYTIPDLGPGTTSRSWTVTTPELPPGDYDVRIRAYDDQDVRTPASEYVRFSLLSTVPGDAEPDTVLDETGTNQDIESLTVTISGVATDDVDIARVALIIFEDDGNDYVNQDGTLSRGYAEVNADTLGTLVGGSRTFSHTITLPRAGNYVIDAVAVDTVGQYDVDDTGASVRWLIYPGDSDPYTWIQGPNDGDTLTAGSVVISGRAFDDLDLATCDPGVDCGVSRVQVRITNGTGDSMTSTGSFVSSEVWIEAFVTNPDGAFTNWNYATPALPPGSYTIQARAQDVHGQWDQTPNPAPAPAGEEPDRITVSLQ